jgi:hypothetical protein
MPSAELSFQVLACVQRLSNLACAVVDSHALRRALFSSLGLRPAAKQSRLCSCGFSCPPYSLALGFISVPPLLPLATLFRRPWSFPTHRRLSIHFLQVGPGFALPLFPILRMSSSLSQRRSTPYGIHCRSLRPFCRFSSLRISFSILHVFLFVSAFSVFAPSLPPSFGSSPKLFVRVLLVESTHFV